MKPSLQAIAEKAGVSTATVSRALNDRAGVNPETRERVLAIARELGYMPNAAAQGLATARTHTLGLISYERPPQRPLSNFPDELLQGVEQEARKHGYHVMATFVNDDLMQDAMRVPMIGQQRCDGLILIGPALKAGFVLQLHSSGIPLVLVDNLLNETTIDAVVCDNVTGAYRATRHLIDVHGLRRLVFISGPAQWFSSHERRTGYERALAEIGEPPRILHIDDTIMPLGRAAMHEALERYPDLEGVVAVNDATAFGAIEACREQELDVPQDIAVVGFDDVGWAALHTPPLTTVRIFTRETGIQAARHLVDQIERNSPPGFVLRLGTELVIRRSCGCPPDAAQQASHPRQ